MRLSALLRISSHTRGPPHEICSIIDVSTSVTAERASTNGNSTKGTSRWQSPWVVSSFWTMRLVIQTAVDGAGLGPRGRQSGNATSRQRSTDSCDGRLDSAVSRLLSLLSPSETAARCASRSDRHSPFAELIRVRRRSEYARSRRICEHQLRGGTRESASRYVLTLAKTELPEPRAAKLRDQGVIELRGFARKERR
jgi:hypothetical protein